MSRILETMLRECFPERRFEVVNTGMTAINSHAVLPVVRDSRRLAADLYLVYLGNNEVVGPFGPGTVFAGSRAGLPLIRAGLQLRTLRLGQLLSQLAASAGRRTRPSWRGMEMFAANRVAADDPRLEATYADFRANLHDICAAGREAGVPVALATVVGNLKDLPPFASLHRNGLSEAQRVAWRQAYEEGRAWEAGGHHSAALENYRSAVAIDDRHADLHYRMGRCLLAAGALAEARGELASARDLDAMRFRADGRINGIIREVARREGVALVDAELRIPGPEGPPAGAELLHEHVHPTFEGNYAIARVLFEEAVRRLPLPHETGAPSPPSLERCAELTLYTAVARHSDCAQVRRMTRRPPFAKEVAAAVSADCRRLEALLTAEEAHRTFQAYERRAQDQPEDLLAGRVFAQMLRTVGRWDESIRQYRRVLERYPDSVVIRIDLGRTLLARDRLDEAIEQARQALKVDAQAEDAWTLLGLARSRRGDVRQAEQDLRRAVELRPQSAEARAALAQSLLAWGRPSEAVPHFIAALESDPEIAACHFGLGVAYLRQGDPAKALESISRAGELAPENAHYQLQAAQAAWLAQQPDRARAAYARALGLDPRLARQDPDLARALEAR